MILTITGLLKAKNPKNAEKLLRTFGKAISLDFSIFDYEPYLNDQSTYRFHCQIELEEQNLKDAYFEIPFRFANVYDRWNMLE